MSEPVQLGGISCDFMGRREFRQLCRQWLVSEQFHHVVTLNPEMVVLAEHHASFRRAVMAADVRVPDGAGLIWARWYLRSKHWPLLPSLLAFLFQNVERVTGVEAVITLGQLCEELGRPLYLLGGTRRQRKRTAAMLGRRFKRLLVATSPDYGSSVREPMAVLSDIAQRQPIVVLVALGAPKQTEWIERHRERLSGVRIAVGVGGAFAMLSEDLPRAPRAVRALNLEWLWRLYLEPQRLPRSWRATVRFPLLIHRQKKSQ